MDQRKEEEEGSVLLKEPTDRQREEEKEEEGSVLPKEPTDRQREEEEVESLVLLKEPTGWQREEEEEERSGEPAGRRSQETADKEDEAERSSDEESMAASTLFVHPCSLLRYLVRAFACCLGMPEDSFGGGTAKRSVGAASPASVGSSPEGEADRSAGATGFYMQEVITRVFVVRRPRPSGPGYPREGSGGNGGHHH